MKNLDLLEFQIKLIINYNKCFKSKSNTCCCSTWLGNNNQTYNINGDTAAGAIAKSLKSRRLLLMTNVEGVLDKEKN